MPRDFYDGERAGLASWSESKHRVARPPFVVCEISDSKAAPGKPAARAKTGATARGERTLTDPPRSASFALLIGAGVVTFGRNRAGGFAALH